MDQFSTEINSITDDTNKVVWQWSYSAFGENKPSGILQATPNPADPSLPKLLKASSPAVTMNLRFPGQYWDDEAKLSYNYFRSYSPGQGRYSQSDPIGLEGGWSRFGYVNQDALNHADPLGLDVMSTIADRVAGIPYGRPGDQYDTTFTITKRGACEGSRDPMCAAGMAAAGLQGPYYSETKTYSSMCVLGLGVGVKGGGAVAGNAIANQVPRVASQLGVGARAISLIGRGIAIFTNPATAAASIGYAVGPLLEHCEVKPPICEAK